MRLLLLVLAIAAPLGAGWKAGVARERITPDEPVWLAGYAARTKPFEAVRQEIWAKAVALEDEGGAVSVLVTLDLVGVRRSWADDVVARVEQQHGVKRARLLLNASHTHSAPLTGDPGSYSHLMTPEQRAAVERYTSGLRDKLVTLVGAALAARQPAVLQFEQGLAGITVNRRRVGHRGYPGPVDQDVPVLAVRGTDGSLRAVVFGYACHNTVMGDYTVHGDYAGYAQAALESQFRGAVALFVAGCGADANPLPRRSPALLRGYGETLAAAVSQVLEGRMKPVEGPLGAVFTTVELRFQTPSREEFERRLRSGNEREKRHAERQLAKLAAGGITTHYPYPLQAWRFGNAFTLLALGGEVVADYAHRFKSRYGWDGTWVAGYSNDVFAYIPSARVLREGGYEGGEAMLFGSFPGPFSDDVEETIAARVDALFEALKQ